MTGDDSGLTWRGGRGGQRDDDDWQSLIASVPTGDYTERQAIDSRKRWLRVNALAAAELAAESALALPESVSGAHLLAEPDDEPAWLIEGLWPSGGNVMCAAQYKAGKTTLAINLIRSLADGEPFLGRFPVKMPPGRLFVIDAEMQRRTMRRWLAGGQIARADRFEYVNLRGRCAAFDMRSSHVRAQWAGKIRAAGAAFVTLGPVGAIFAALDIAENDTREVGAFLDGYQAMLTEAEVQGSYTAHHMGHAGERSRGTSRLRDWPDAEWQLVRQEDSPRSPRYLSAYGRDVDVPECRLDYEPETRRLWIAGGSRRDVRAENASAALLSLLAATPGLCRSAIEAELSGDHGRQAIRDAISEAVKDSRVTVADGPRGAKVHALAD